MTDDLLTRLQSAETGSRELSDEVLLALGWKEQPYLPARKDLAAIALWLRPDGKAYEPLERPSPSESADDALALVPEGWDYKIGIDLDEPPACRAFAWLHFIRTKQDLVPTLAEDAHTPALALCAAILRAHEMEKG